MLDAHLRHSATTLLKLAIRVAPPDTRDWGQAMMRELHYVEGPWAAAMWALGGSSVLAKQALVSLVIPHGRGEYIPDGGLFAKSRTLRNAALALSGAVVLAALLFFAAPPFRQAFRVAMTPWYSAYQFASGNSQSGLVNLARRAGAQHDAEGLAFCAVRLQDPAQSARLAEEAVSLDPNLVWVYAILAGRHSDLPQTAVWVGKLEGWDSQNALVSLNAAEAIDPKPLYEGKFAALTPEQQQKWERAMAAAFAAPKFDDYLDRLAELDRRVVQRFDYNDPYDLDSRLLLGETQYAFENAVRYAEALLDTGATLELKGDRKRAREQYWRVARFGQLVDSHGRTELERRMGTALQGMAYRQFQVSYQKEGDDAQAELFGYLAAKFHADWGEPVGSPAAGLFGWQTAERNAAVVQISGLMSVFFLGLVGIAALILIIDSRRRAVPAIRRARPVATIVALTGALGLLFSTVTLYLTYRPYWYLFQSALLSGEKVPSSDLESFLIFTQRLPGISPHGYIVFLSALIYSGSPSFLFYVWAGVTLLCLGGLVLLLLRRLTGRPRAKPP